MNLKEFKELCIITRNEIVSRNNSVNSNYILVDRKVRDLKSKTLVLTKEIVSLVLAVSLVGGSATFIGVNTKRERQDKLNCGIYSVEDYNNKRKVDYFTAYFGYVLALLVLYSGLSFVKGSSVFKSFFSKFRRNVKEYKEGIVSGCELFADMREDISYLMLYLCQYEECKKCYANILNEYPYLEGDELINKISDVLDNLDVESIRKNIDVKKKILG